MDHDNYNNTTVTTTTSSCSNDNKIIDNDDDNDDDVPAVLSQWRYVMVYVLPPTAEGARLSGQTSGPYPGQGVGRADSEHPPMVLLQVISFGFELVGFTAQQHNIGHMAPKIHSNVLENNSFMKHTPLVLVSFVAYYDRTTLLFPSPLSKLARISVTLV